LKSEVESAVKAGLKAGMGQEKTGFLLVFIAVLREEFETVLFILNSKKIGRYKRSVR